MLTLPAVVAETLGTGLIVLVGTGAIAWDALHPGLLGTAGVALIFGLAVMLAITLFARYSGAHCNPVVSLALYWSGHLPKQRLLPYITAQCLGAVGASALLAWQVGRETGLGHTLPSGAPSLAFLLEWGMATMLILLILFAVHRQMRAIQIALMVGALVALEAFLGGPISGASMNPARSLGPALLTWHWPHFWIYLLAPAFGAWTAVWLCRAGQQQCCQTHT